MQVVSEESRRRMSESAKRRCTPEWIEKQKARGISLDKDIVVKLYTEGHTQKEIGDTFGVSQKTVWKFMKRHDIKARKPAKRDQTRDKNSSWRGGRTIDEYGYVMIKCDGHPRASLCGGYVPEHVLVKEHDLGRYLNWYGQGNSESEIVHHINGKKGDNRPENLLVTNFSEHMRIHREEEEVK